MLIPFILPSISGKNLDYFAFTWHWVQPVGPAGLLAFFASSWQALQVL
jgi:cellobiose-specific phosphotransferase system component IIC